MQKKTLQLQNGRIRPAEPKDAPEAAPLIVETGYQTIEISFGTLKKGNSILKGMFARPGNIHSYQHGAVFTLDEKVAGLLVGYTVEDDKRESFSSAILILRLMGIYGLLLLERLLRIKELIGEISTNDYYVHCLAVRPELRSLGIGKLLMHEAEIIARRYGKHRVSLLVEARNIKAIKFYEREGYKIIEPRFDPSLKRRFGFDSYMKMAKELNVPHSSI